MATSAKGKRWRQQAVRAGALLVLLDPRDALVQLRRSEAELERASTDLERLEFLLRQGGVSRQEVDRARASFRQAQGQLTRSQATALQARASERQVGVDRDRAAAAEALPREDVGAGSGFYNLTRQLGGTFGIALLTVVLDHQRAVHRALLVEHLATTNPLLQLRLQAIAAWNPGAQERALALLSQQVDRQASLLAYGDVFRMVGLMFCWPCPWCCCWGGPSARIPSRSRGVLVEEGSSG